jgi:indole-3-glycerol phosphate synthase
MSYLDGLIAGARRRAGDLKSDAVMDALEARVAGVEPARGFATALKHHEVAVIAEIKRASPSAGDLNVELNAREFASAYGRGGAAAVSVLTEPDLFKGSLEDLDAARSAGLPVLRKDFIVDQSQVIESRAWGADAVLLIVRAVGDELERLYQSAVSLGMGALVEVYDESELDAALELGASLIGVNHRNLRTFEVDPHRTARLAPKIPRDRTIVALSGIHSRDDVVAARAAGAGAVLVGEALVTAEDPAAAVAMLRGEP